MIETPVMLTPQDLDAFLEHQVRLLAQGGSGDTPLFSAHEPSRAWPVEEKRKTSLERWSKTPKEPGWGRSWGIVVDGRFVGHLDLFSKNIPTAIHRAMIGMGIESGFRGQGHGESLIRTAIAWAKEQGTIDWIDLGVFEHNLKARRLYEKCGFVENGRIQDVFRIQGQSINDITMALRI